MGEDVWMLASAHGEEHIMLHDSSPTSFMSHDSAPTSFFLSKLFGKKGPDMREVGQTGSYNKLVGLNTPARVCGQVLNIPYNQDQKVKQKWGQLYRPVWGFPSARDVRAEWG